MSFNKSIQMLTIAWNEKRFVESKSARQVARRSVFRAATTLLNTELKTLENQNEEIRHEINRCYSDLRKYDDKLQILDNMTHLATQSLEVYFQRRMENLRTFVTEQCRVISDGIQEEADHWKEIHAMLEQKLVVPGDLRSYGGGNGLPRAVKQSPNFSRIVEEEEQEQEDQNDVTAILHSRTLTPLVTQSLKRARLLASKLSQEISKLNMSATIHEEPPPTSDIIPETHVTLGDVSAIEKTVEMDHALPNPDLSVSLLPYIPTVNHEEDINNKSIASTISDKTFVKTSLKPFSSDEESDEDDDDTIIDESIIPDEIESARPLLLTADRSIRRPPSLEKAKIKQEKVSFRQPLNTFNRTILVNNNTFDTFRSPIMENSNTSKLPTILSNEELENQPVDECKNPVPNEEVLPPAGDNNLKRRTTRRTTTRLILDNPAPVELPGKPRYATRYSTRLATSISHDEISISRTSTIRRRTTRFTSE